MDLTDPNPRRIVGVPNPEQVTGGLVCLGPVGAPAFDPATFARDYLGRFPLPVPGASIPPGKMIVAFPATVVTRAPTTFEVTAATPFGPLTISARAQIFVDWGDGERTGPYDAPGEAYPEGEIVHRYAEAGSFDVAVVYRWSASWRWGAQGGDIPGTLDSVDRVSGFPVRAYQARTG